MAIAEQWYIAYSKKQLEFQQFADFNESQKEHIRGFFPKLDEMIDRQPEFQYLPYYKSRFLLAHGESGDILTTFLPFAR